VKSASDLPLLLPALNPHPAHRGCPACPDFTEEDARCLAELAEHLDPHLPEIAEQFHHHLLSLSPARGPLGDEPEGARFREAQVEYLQRTLRGPYDEAYFRRRWRIGHSAWSVRRAPHRCLDGFHLYRRLLYPRLLKLCGDDPQRLVAYQFTLDKVFNLDAQLAFESYLAQHETALTELREAARQVEVGSAAKSRFLATLSHEFRTPLNAMLGFAELLEEGVAGPVNADQSEYLQEIRSAGGMLLRLVNELLDLARVEAGRLELLYETFPVAPAVRETVAALRGTAERKGLFLRSEVSADIGSVTADPMRFRQVLSNLLANAIRYTDRGGVTVRAALESRRLRLEVEDSGIGVAPHDRERIFEPFGQLPAAGHRRRDGAGIGLALVREWVESHGGHVRVDAVAGGGSLFQVVLPQAPEWAPAAVEAGDGG